MLRGLFITGTDTGVGKTVISATLMHRYRPLRYWKPIQTGTAIDNDTETVRVIGSCSDHEIFNYGLRFKAPLAPLFAAQHESFSIDLKEVVSLVHGETDDEANDVRWIVEGAGGILVPITKTEMIIDLIVKLGLPALIVARTGLGTINHTLLTIEALVKQKIEIAGVVMVGIENHENVQAIEAFSGVPVIASMPLLDELSAITLRSWSIKHLDSKGLLKKYLS